jgi:hypothetical protein
MTIATSDEPSVGSSTAAARRPSRFLKPRRWRVDVIGAFALVLAAAGLVGSVVLLRTTPAALPTATSAPVVRDQWYLDPPNAQAGQHAALPASAVKDRWYEDAASTTTIPVAGTADTGTTAQVTDLDRLQDDASLYKPATGVTAARDQWYLDHPVPASRGNLSTPVRDQWYLDGRQTPAIVPLKPGGVFDASQPSAVVDTSGGITNIVAPRGSQDPAKDRWYRE